MANWKVCIVVGSGLALAAMAAAEAAEHRTDDGPQWPNVETDGPKWPNVHINPRPAFIDPEQVEDRIRGRKRFPAVKAAEPNRAADPAPPAPAAAARDANASASTARWPTLPPERRPSAFAFEGGARYWYSWGSMNFGFANGSPLFGNPTSTLDWRGMIAHSGEVFGRIDHIPTGYFVKGLFGHGSDVDGHIDDSDFLTGQFKFSDTTSTVSNGSLNYAMLDVGWAYMPVPNVRLSFFAGYHYWREEVTAFGLICNQASVLGCPAQGAVLVGNDTAVLRYQPTWHAVRIGVESRIAIDDRWSVSGEIVGVPYASLRNADSHLLRQDGTDLGPAPNIITTSRYAFGVETELFANYAVTPNIEIGAGVRYWGLATRDGGVRFGPSFESNDSLTRFDQQRYGVLLHAKGRF